MRPSPFPIVAGGALCCLAAHSALPVDTAPVLAISVTTLACILLQLPSALLEGL